MEPGSSGSVMAQQIAERLGFSYFHRDIVEEISKTANSRIFDIRLFPRIAKIYSSIKLVLFRPATALHQKTIISGHFSPKPRWLWYCLKNEKPFRRFQATHWLRYTNILSEYRLLPTV